jgi:TrmH family RNA methyltransferase
VLLREDTLDLMQRPPFAALPPAAWRIVEPALFDTLAETVTPQGILALFPFPDLPIATNAHPLVLLLDQVRDPGNLGTLLRSAVGAGVACVILTPGSVDPFNPKVVRAGMGAHFRVPFRWLDDNVYSWLLQQCPARVVAEADAPLPYDAFDWTSGAALIVGSEATGASAATRDLATARVTIPLCGDLESLNAAIAGSIILFEAARQRRSTTQSSSR